MFSIERISRSFLQQHAVVHRKDLIRGDFLPSFTLISNGVLPPKLPGQDLSFGREDKEREQ